MIVIQKGHKGLSYPLSENGYKEFHCWDREDFRVAIPTFYRATGSLRLKLGNRLAKAAGALNNKKVKSLERSCSDRVIYINGYALNLNVFE